MNTLHAKRNECVPHTQRSSHTGTQDSIPTAHFCGQEREEGDGVGVAQSGLQGRDEQTGGERTDQKNSRGTIIPIVAGWIHE